MTFSPSSSAEDPTFSADATGTYTVQVQYTRGGKTCEDTSGDIVVMKVEIDTPASFPVYVCLDGSLQLDCAVTPGAATGGSYSWDVVSCPDAAVYQWTSAGTASPEFSASTPGLYTVKVEYTKGGVTCDDTSGDIWFVGVSEIQINQNSTWTKVDGDPTEVILKGTIYDFKAIKDPSNAPQWPAGKPTWGGTLGSGTGETKQITFDSSGDGKTLTATCGNTKTATINVIVPQIHRVKFDKYDIYDKQDKWQAALNGDSAVNDPACFKQGTTTNVKIKFYHDKTLTWSTTVQVRADVHFLDEYITGEDYDRTNIALGTSWATEWAVLSEANAESKIKDDYDVDMQWRYQVKSPAGTDDWISTGDSDELRYYLIWDDPKGAASDFEHCVLECACAWAEGEDSVDGARTELIDYIYGHYTWDYNCHQLASNFVRVCWCLGIDALLHRWASNASEGACAVDDMVYQRTREFTPAGGANDTYDWSWHQWAASGGNQYDPSSGETYASTWGGYEDWLFTHYKRCTGTDPYTYNWDANAAGQTSGCEANGIHSMPSPEDWLAPP